MMLNATPEPVTRQVLVVDDADTCSILLEVALLQIPRVAVTCAGSGREALQMLGVPGTHIRALVTDLNMPQVDGFELIARIRADRRFAGLPIIVVSGDTDPRTPERVNQLGADAFFPKPYSPITIQRKLEHLLERNGPSGSAVA